MKKEYGYPTLKVICQASAGNETAIREILKFYDAYICKLCLRPFYHSESGKIIMQVDEELKGRKIPKDQNGNLRQSMETLHRRIPPGYDGRGLGGSRKHRMSRYVFRLCRRTVPLPENRRKIRRTLPCRTQRSRNLPIL